MPLVVALTCNSNDASCLRNNLRAPSFDGACRQCSNGGAFFTRCRNRDNKRSPVGAEIDTYDAQGAHIPCCQLCFCFIPARAVRKAGGTTASTQSDLYTQASISP